MHTGSCRSDNALVVLRRDSPLLHSLGREDATVCAADGAAVRVEAGVDCWANASHLCRASGGKVQHLAGSSSGRA